MMPFPENFPDELFQLFFEYLGTVDLVRISRVSKKWRQLSNDKKFIKKILQLKTNYLLSERPRLWKKLGKTQNSYFHILCDAKFLYFMDLLNSLTPVKLFDYVKKLLHTSPELEDTVREERLEIIVVTPTLLKKLADLGVEVIIKEMDSLLKLKQGELPHGRTKKFIEAMLTIPEFSQNLSGDQAAKLARLGISPKSLLEENVARFGSKDLKEILQNFLDYGAYSLKLETARVHIILELLETSMIFEKLGNKKFLDIVITSSFAESLLKKPNLLEKLSCKDILQIIEIVLSLYDEDIGHTDIKPLDEFTPNLIFRKYKEILEKKSDFTEEMAGKLTKLKCRLGELNQDAEEVIDEESARLSFLF